MTREVRRETRKDLSASRELRAPATGARSRLRLILLIGAGVGVAGATAFGARAVQNYALSSPRFALPGSPAEGEETAKFVIEGASYSSRARIARVFEEDFNRSVAKIPLAERRRRLLAIDWVEDATLSRIWPNQLFVRVRERVPVAWARINDPGPAAGFTVRLIDSQGVLLPAPPQRKFAFPVVNGLTDRQSETERKERLRPALRLLRDLGPASNLVSEIDVSTLENIRAVLKQDGRALELWFGEGDFDKRYQHFARNYPEIRRQSPASSTFDLRHDGRIIAKETPSNGS